MPSRFALLFLTFLSALVGCYIAAAAIVNPRLDFGGRLLFPPLVRDSRQEKMDLFERFNGQRPVDGVILGSSRSMLLAPADLESLTGKRVFNFSVDSARAEDYLAIFDWVRSHGARLNVLLLGLDVEALHDNDQWDLRLKRNVDLMRELEKQQQGTYEELQLVRRRFMSAFTMSYVYDMVNVVSMAAHPPPQPVSRANTFDEAGLLHYVFLDQSLAAGTFDRDKQIVGSQEEYLGRFIGMTTLSKRRKEYIETLLKNAKDHGIAVALWITPIHQTLADYLGRKTQYSRLLMETRVYAAELRRRYDILVFDFSEPRFFGAIDSGWYDGAHMDTRNAALITKKVAVGLLKHGL